MGGERDVSGRILINRFAGLIEDLDLIIDTGQNVCILMSLVRITIIYLLGCESESGWGRCYTCYQPADKLCC